LASTQTADPEKAGRFNQDFMAGFDFVSSRETANGMFVADTPASDGGGGARVIAGHEVLRAATRSALEVACQTFPG
jgi:hypothetical protein